jgi:hypothetical protein
MSKTTKSGNSPTLIDMSTYDFKNNLIFSPVKTESVPGSGKDGKKGLSYRRINITTKLPEGGEGQLIFDTPGENHFCFGIKEFEQDGKINGRSMGFSLYDKDGPSEKQRKWVENFENMMEYCKQHLVKVRDDMELFDLELTDLKKFNPLYWRINKEGPNRGKRIEGVGPTMNAKIWESKGSVKTVFHEIYYDKGHKKARPIIDPINTLVGTYCSIRSAMIFDSIYIGNSKSPQIKHYHVVCSMNNRNPKPILDIDEDEEPIDQPTNVAGAMLDGIDHVEEEKKEEDIENSEEEEKKEEVKPKKIVKRKKVAS